MNHDIKIIVVGHCGSGKTVLGYRILELLKADGWDVETEPMQVGPSLRIDEIKEQANRSVENTESARWYLRKQCKVKVTEQSVNRSGAVFANPAS
jgi:ABC-type oligopeptide transport system ATPase subunit